MADHPMRRQADQGTLGKTKSFMQEWGWAVYLAVAVALSLGYKYTTPSDEIKAIKTEQGTLRSAVEELKVVTKDQAADIKSFKLLQCFNTSYTTGQLRLVGIDCTGIR